MELWRVPSARLTPRSLIYVAAVALVAAVGFVEQSPWPIVVAALLALPASIVTLPCYYVVHGVLALIPGANPSSSTGSSSSDAYGSTLTTVATGTPAAWFTVTTHVLGILAGAGNRSASRAPISAWLTGARPLRRRRSASRSDRQRRA